MRFNTIRIFALSCLLVASSACSAFSIYDEEDERPLTQAEVDALVQAENARRLALRDVEEGVAFEGLFEQPVTEYELVSLRDECLSADEARALWSTIATIAGVTAAGGGGAAAAIEEVEQRIAAGGTAAAGGVIGIAAFFVSSYYGNRLASMKCDQFIRARRQ